MMVMMIATTPSVKAVSRSLPTRRAAGSGHGRLERRVDAGLREDAQEVLGVELVAHRPGAFAQRSLEAADRIAAALDVRVVRREQVEFGAGLVDQVADRLENGRGE